MKSPRASTSLSRTRSSTPFRSRALAPSTFDQFVPKTEIDERYIDSPYYIAP